MSYKSLNVNETILVKLTNDGFDLWKKYNDELYLSDKYKKDISTYKNKIDENGYTSFHLWEFMSIFGVYFYNGTTKQVIENNNILIDKINLK